jgi:hypothetical protein
MKSFKDKYEYKKQIEKLVLNFDIKQDVFERVFATVFVEIFEKEQKYKSFLDFYKTSLVDKIIYDLSHLKKQSKGLFLLMFEDYQKLNNELVELEIKIKKECKKPLSVTAAEAAKIDISRFIILQSIIHKLDLKDFKPEQTTSPEFLACIEANIEKPGLFFLYNIDKELMFIGKSSQLSGKIIDSVWERNIDGYLSVAHTKTKSDIHVYAPYYIVNEKPLLNESISETDHFSFELKPLEKSDLIKIYV